MALILHAAWSSDHLHVWAESLSQWLMLADAQAPEEHAEDTVDMLPPHPHASTHEEILVALDGFGDRTCASEIRIRIPRDLLGPHPSDQLVAVTGTLNRGEAPWLSRFRIPTCVFKPADAVGFLLAVSSGEWGGHLELGHDLRFWSTVARLVADRCEDQRFIPTLRQDQQGRLRARWRPWLQDEEAAERLTRLLQAMPPITRAVDDDIDDAAWPRLEAALEAMTDGVVRSMLARESFGEAIEGRTFDDPHVQWLSGLLNGTDLLALEGDDAVSLLRGARAWISRLDDVAEGQSLRLRLDLQPPASEAGAWQVSLGLASVSDATDAVTAEAVWRSDPEVLLLAGDSDPHDVLISELGKAARIWPDLDPLLGEATPSSLSLSTRQAWSFLGEYRSLLEESGCIVAVPPWWGGQENTLGLRMIIESPDMDDIDGPPNGLAASIRYRWQVAVGDQPLSLEALRRLRDQQTPLVQVDGRWIEVDQAQLSKAIELLERHDSTEASLLEAMRVVSEATEEETGLTILGLEADGWVAGLLDGPSGEGVTELGQPEPFRGTLRPYQMAGLNWLGFLDRYGLGGCLADDMGLGKTVQLIALLQHERKIGDVGPTLLVVPTSVVGNWNRELERFAPELSAHTQHGPDRPMGTAFRDAAMGADVTITTYALVARDSETLEQVNWHRVVLDEAQYIKNPPTKQAQAIRALSATRRIALTGTPVENRLSELWSIMEFCNPGFLGDGSDFRRKFARPIERHRDAGAAASLRRLVQPFVLRRLKTDRNVISDLPECVETREFATLTPEQAALYQSVVDQMIGQVDRTEGIQRRGIILAMLARLKQICDHPALAESGEEVVAAASTGDSIKRLSERSGKSARLCQLLEEVIATGERALIFTQYRRMGRLLSAMIEHDLGCRSLFLHGGTPMAKRQKMIDSFQDETSDTPVFVLSLKAGGLGLNLTAANHVFHFDRWWNPAVEKQATDRAFRIGQTRTVHVHKFVCMGTLEERIDRMIEEKTQLAEQIIGSGDDWLTELTTGQLRDMLMLRSSAMEMEA